MAKNISLLGADYPDVPAVQLPQTGGGTATFYDINVIDNLNSDSSTDALSAKQGRVLSEKIRIVDLSLQQATFTSGAAFIQLTNIATTDMVFIQQMYTNNAYRYVYTAQPYSSNRLVVYIRNGDGTIPPDGTAVTLSILVCR